MTGCRSIPEQPSLMTCDDLDYIADEQVKSNAIPYFATQTKYPGDWRPYATNAWIREGSRKQVRVARKDYVQMEILSIGSEVSKQTPYRIRIETLVCKNASKKTSGTLYRINFLEDSPEKFSQAVPFSFLGNAPEDFLARLVCGYQKLPEPDKDQIMAQRWKACRNPVKQP